MRRSLEERQAVLKTAILVQAGELEPTKMADATFKGQLQILVDEKMVLEPPNPKDKLTKVRRSCRWCSRVVWVLETRNACVLRPVLHFSPPLRPCHSSIASSPQLAAVRRRR